MRLAPEIELEIKIMKKKELESLRKKETQELVKELAEARQKASLTWSKMMVGKEKNLKAGKKARREIAQILTVISEKGEVKTEEKENK